MECSIYLYGSESWSLSILDIRKIEAFEMWSWRRMMKISWIESKSNKKMLNMIKELRQILLDTFRGLFIINIIEWTINKERKSGR